MNVLDSKYIIPLSVFIIGLACYMANIYQDVASVMIVMGILGLMANCNEWSSPNPKTVNIIVLSSVIAFVNPVLGLIYLCFAAYVLFCALASKPLTAEEKMLQIHVRYHNGTSGMWQKIGIEHEVRAMLENDPRIENFDIGLLSPSDNGRYPEY